MSDAIREAFEKAYRNKSVQHLLTRHERLTDQYLDPAMNAAFSEFRRAIRLIPDGEKYLLGAGASTAPSDQVAAWNDVLAERRRQVHVEGWSENHDDEHGHGEMAEAAACYALCAALGPADRAVVDSSGVSAVSASLVMKWPWDLRWFKPTTRRRDLIKAGALILAELERLDRATRSNDRQVSGA